MSIVHFGPDIEDIERNIAELAENVRRWCARQEEEGNLLESSLAAVFPPHTDPIVLHGLPYNIIITRHKMQIRRHILWHNQWEKLPPVAAEEMGGERFKLFWQRWGAHLLRMCYTLKEF